MVQPFSWGGVAGADCCTAACDAFAALFGIDPMASVRGRYCDLRSAVQLIRTYGTFVDMVDTLCTEAGLIEGLDDPGAIGVVTGDLDGHGGLVICSEPGRWVGKTKSGYLVGLSPGHKWGFGWAS